MGFLVLNTVLDIIFYCLILLAMGEETKNFHLRLILLSFPLFNPFLDVSQTIIVFEIDKE